MGQCADCPHGSRTEAGRSFCCQDDPDMIRMVKEKSSLAHEVELLRRYLSPPQFINRHARRAAKSRERAPS